MIQENAAFVDNVVQVNAGMRYLAAKMALGAMGRGMISNLTHENLANDLEILLPIDRHASFTKLWMSIEQYEMEKIEAYLPAGLTRKVRFFTLGQYASLIFFRSLMGSLMGAEAELSREDFYGQASLLIDKKSLKSEWKKAATHMEFGQKKDVINWDFSSDSTESEPAVPQRARAKNFYVLIHEEGGAGKFVIHDHFQMPVKGYRIHSGCFIPELIDPQTADDPKFDRMAEDFYDLVLTSLQLTGLIVKPSRPRGYIGGGGSLCTIAEPDEEGFVEISLGKEMMPRSGY